MGSAFIPWVLPHRDHSPLWRTSSPLAYWVDRKGKDPVEELLERQKGHQFHGVVPFSEAQTIHELFEELLETPDWVLLEEDISWGEWEAEQPEGSFKVLTMDLYNTLTGGERKDGRRPFHFGFRHQKGWGIPCLRIYGWKRPTKPVTERTMADEILLVMPHDPEHPWVSGRVKCFPDQKAPGRFPHMIQSCAPGAYGFLEDVVARYALWLAVPASKVDIRRDLASPMRHLATLTAWSPQASGEVTVGVALKYLSKVLGKTLRTPEEAGKALAIYVQAKEAALIEAIGLPRISVPIPPGQTSKAPMVEEIRSVVDALPELSHQPGFVGVDVWARRLVCRALLLLHTRGGHIVDPVYRTTMYPLDTLLVAMIRAFKTDSASYLDPVLLYGTTVVPEESTMVVEQEAPERQALEGIPDGLF